METLLFSGTRDENGQSTNNDAILLLMTEIRSLRKQLESSIQSNNSLRQMLQNQLLSPPRHPESRSPGRGLGTKTSPVSSPCKYTSFYVKGYVFVRMFL